MKEILVLRDLECIKAIAHPKRIDILKAFNNLPLSAKQLSQILDEPHAKINYHIKALYKVGILELVEEKIKSGIVEKYYYPKAKSILIDKNVINISLEKDDETIQSKYEDIVDLFYQAVEKNLLDEENLINYNNIYLSKNELIELNNTIKYKIEDIINNRNRDNEDIQYDIVMASIPVLKKEVCN